MLSSCSGNLVNFQAAISFDKTLRTTCQQLRCHCLREWSFSSEMDVNVAGSHSNEKQSLECPKSTNMAKKSVEKEVSMNTSVFVNHAAIAWHENRRKWVGNQSRQSKTVAKDPIISWSMTYDELLSTNDPFAEPIPLTEMVDFLVDIWHDEGLFD
ncbi:uncharacterized protein LOC105641111 isoform X1 [Jatropha curcas]|uniref:uncharacterized protein LOC105641111 isoform X1 n=2 Tax=Jatropha curcas TaxID=180498 RepID=UPI0018948D1E|nr:uncharacterized protein LOC105641111 isoform X1 [Jatropha curcas]